MREAQAPVRPRARSWKNRNSGCPAFDIPGPAARKLLDQPPLRQYVAPMDILEIAKVAHEANRALCQTQGDTSQLPWDEAPDWQLTSAINGVRHAADLGAGPEDSHKSWLAEKEADGWTYGEVKDPEAKTHPCFRPYAELPASQKIKDTLFLAVARALL